METISRIAQFFKVALVEFKMGISSELTYRWQILLWVISDATQPLIFATLWSVVASTGDRDFTADQMVSYYFMVTIVGRLTQDWSIQFISNSIIKGEFSKYLVKPFSYMSEMLGMSMAIRTIRLLLILPFLLVGYYLFRDLISYELTPNSFTLFLFALLIGYIMNFILGNIFALVAFFSKQIYGLRALYINFVSILSGEYIPLKVLAVGAFFLFEMLPFRYVLSFPIEIISGDLTHDQIGRGFGIALFWLVALSFIYQFTYKMAIRRYEAEGI